MLTHPFHHGTHHIRILSRDRGEISSVAAGDGERRMRFASYADARAFAARLLADPYARFALQGAIRSDPSRQLSHDNAVSRTASRLHSGELVVLTVLRPLVTADFGDETEEPRSSFEQTTETTWVEFIVLDDATGDPVGDVKLGVQLAKGGRDEHTVPSSGILEFDPTEAGTCIVDTRLDEPALGNTLEFLRVGEPTRRPARPVWANPKKKRPCILEVARHRVRSSDSLDAIAKSGGMTWQELARYNFGTDDPKKVNVCLREQVGSHKRTKDGKNYVFDESDHPGIVYVPRPLRLPALRTGLTHTIIVRRLERPVRPFHFSH